MVTRLQQAGFVTGIAGLGIAYFSNNWPKFFAGAFLGAVGIAAVAYPIFQTKAALPPISLQGAPPSWKERFQKIQGQPWPAKQPLLRLIRLGTEDAIRNGFYFHNGKKVPLDPLTIKKMKAGTTLYPTPPRIDGVALTQPDINIQGVAGDVIDDAIALKNRGMSPVFINMANAFGPGGGYKQDHPAQEENAFRRSLYQECLGRIENLAFHARQKPYPIPKGGAIYTPHLLAFRGNEASGYPFLPKPVELAAIAIAGPDFRAYEGNPETVIPNSRGHFERLVKTIENFLSIAVKHKHDAVVLSALGCGAFLNEPVFVAQCFKHVLKQPKWRGKFKAVHFAIYDDGHGPNLKSFQKHLHTQPVGRG
ncbi:MAG TPA: TIGR02452 family protein [Chlamydiales bacterium]|nr:TIGR02452 family protein [Chlamydiales bacterium]